MEVLKKAYKTSDEKVFEKEDDAADTLTYLTGYDLAQSTGTQRISAAINATNSDESCSGILHLFAPSSTTFVKHFIVNTNAYGESLYTHNLFV